MSTPAPRPMWIYAAFVAIGLAVLLARPSLVVSPTNKRASTNIQGYTAEKVQLNNLCPEGLGDCLAACDNLGDEQGGSAAKIGCIAACGRDCPSDRGGCYNGWCWAGCLTGIPFISGKEWCYTTRGYSQDHNYVRCNSGSDCDWGWACGGPCAVF